MIKALHPSPATLGRIQGTSTKTGTSGPTKSRTDPKASLWAFCYKNTHQPPRAQNNYYCIIPDTPKYPECTDREKQSILNPGSLFYRVHEEKNRATTFHTGHRKAQTAAPQPWRQQPCTTYTFTTFLQSVRKLRSQGNKKTEIQTMPPRRDGRQHQYE